MAKVETGFRNIVEAGMFNTSMKTERNAIERRKAYLEAELRSAEGEAPMPALHPALADIYRDKVGRLQESLSDPSSRSEAIGALRSLIERIIVTPNTDDRGSTAVLEGDLAKLLRDAASSKDEARAVSAGCSTKLVAGVGFEPTTFRL